MLQHFLNNITVNSLFTKQNKLLLAISGGADSVALAHLLNEGNFNFELAHCNFKLRGKDSDADEKFCVVLAKKLNVKIHIQQFDVHSYCKINKVSTQMAARNLRYTWFLNLIEIHKFNYLLTAHHANDNVETVLINMLRGTGVKGLVGIQQKNNNVIRPLLPFVRTDIDTYIKKNKLKFRVDKSNLQDTYERNFLRLHVIPKLKKLTPALEYTFTNNSSIFKQEADIVTDFLNQKQNELLITKNNLFYINKQKLKAEKHSASILYFILNAFGFSASQIQDVKKNIVQNGLVGKMFSTKTHLLTIDRTDLVIKKIDAINTNEFKVNSLKELNNYFKIEKLNSFQIPQQNQLIININQLIFPLTIRSKKTGDTFKPFGMKGFKLVSHFLKQYKLNNFNKQNIKLLVNGNNEIIWVVNYRSDDRYKVNQASKTLVKFSTIDN